MKKLSLLLMTIISLQLQGQSNTDPIYEKLRKDLNPSNSNPDYQNSPQRFNADEENFDRYKNSPCADELGFIPGRDNETLYKICEEEKRRKQNEAILKYIGGVLIALGAIIFIIRAIKKKQTLTEDSVTEKKVGSSKKQNNNIEIARYLMENHPELTNSLLDNYILSSDKVSKESKNELKQMKVRGECYEYFEKARDFQKQGKHIEEMIYLDAILEITDEEDVIVEAMTKKSLSLLRQNKSKDFEKSCIETCKLFENKEVDISDDEKSISEMCGSYIKLHLEMNKEVTPDNLKYLKIAFNYSDELRKLKKSRYNL